MAELDVVVAGGGIVGLATALALAEGGRAVSVAEAEGELASHQTGHNSGVLHSGLYYRPDSLKARLCTAGREALERLCEDEGIPYRRCGKLVVAVDRREVDRLDELAERGRRNGLRGLRRLDGEGIAELEPQARGAAALWVPATGLVDFRRVAQALAERLRRLGGEVHTASPVRKVREAGDGVTVEAGDATLRARHLVNCAGLQSDRLARLCGLRPGLRIVPFRGDFYRLRHEQADRLTRPIYPVPDPRLPFLGVHLTPTLDGVVKAGPNAVLALHRHGYRPPTLSLADAAETLAYPGFWLLALRHWRFGATEQWRAWSRRRFAAALRRLVPSITADDLERAGCGIRAQAVDRRGHLIDDFRIVDGERSTHVLNAPSPAATAAIPIGRTIARRVIGRL